MSLRFALFVELGHSEGQCAMLKLATPHSRLICTNLARGACATSPIRIIAGRFGSFAGLGLDLEAWRFVLLHLLLKGLDGGHLIYVFVFGWIQGFFGGDKALTHVLLRQLLVVNF